MKRDLILLNLKNATFQFLGFFFTEGLFRVRLKRWHHLGLQKGLAEPFYYSSIWHGVKSTGYFHFAFIFCTISSIWFVFANLTLQSISLCQCADDRRCAMLKQHKVTAAVHQIWRAVLTLLTPLFITEASCLTSLTSWSYRLRCDKAVQVSPLLLFFIEHPGSFKWIDLVRSFENFTGGRKNYWGLILTNFPTSWL